MTRHLLAAALAAGTLLAAAAPAQAQDRFDWRPVNRDFRIAGPGVPILYPELRDTPRGNAFVMRNFDWNRNGVVERREADAANRAFARIAGPHRDRFDWNAHGPDRMILERQAPGGGWDRRAMHDYGFRQTPRGATLTLSEDVLFATDSDVLRPAAIAKLRPLAQYLRDNAGVRVAVDGFTDSRGSAAHNQDLSQRRAASVRNALEGLGADRARFMTAGHGERDPVATNATAAGMRQNRRVEVTLLGRRAADY